MENLNKQIELHKEKLINLIAELGKSKNIEEDIILNNKNKSEKEFLTSLYEIKNNISKENNILLASKKDIIDKDKIKEINNENKNEIPKSIKISNIKFNDKSKIKNDIKDLKKRSKTHTKSKRIEIILELIQKIIKNLFIILNLRI